MGGNGFSVAVLFTCFNRKGKTVRCIKSLLAQKDMPQFDLYVCDDASTDGTVAAIAELVPNAHILNGTGNLFWSRGMHIAMKAAVEKGYDYYLMVNDDVEFFDTMWDTMFEAFESRTAVGVVGYTVSRSTNTITYGGRRMIKTRTNYITSPVVDICAEKYNTVDIANWNCFLIDSYVVSKIGLIDNFYEHGLGDYDYCLRMRKNRLDILVGKQVVGYCENNSRQGTYLDGSLPRKVRLRKMHAQNGFPVASWWHFVNKHYGIHKYRNAITPYIKNLYAILCRKDIK